MFFKKKVEEKKVVVTGQKNVDYDIEEMHVPEEAVYEVLYFVDNYKHCGHAFAHDMNKRLFEILPRLEEGFSLETDKTKGHSNFNISTWEEHVILKRKTGVWIIEIYDYSRKIKFVRYTEKGD